MRKIMTNRVIKILKEEEDNLSDGYKWHTYPHLSYSFKNDAIQTVDEVLHRIAEKIVSAIEEEMDKMKKGILYVRKVSKTEAGEVSEVCCTCVSQSLTSHILGNPLHIPFLVCPKCGAHATMDRLRNKHIG